MGSLAEGLTIDAADLMRILLWMAGLIVALVGAVLAFLVAWQSRQDVRVAGTVDRLSRVEERLAEYERYAKGGIEELFKKWDRIITGQDQPFAVMGRAADEKKPVPAPPVAGKKGG